MGRLSVQVTPQGGDELALLLQGQVQVVLLMAGDVLQDLVDQVAVLWTPQKTTFSSETTAPPAGTFRRLRALPGEVEELLASSEEGEDEVEGGDRRSGDRTPWLSNSS